MPVATREGEVNVWKKIRIICVDDHPVVREGVASIIALQADMEMIGAAESGAEGLQLSLTTTPDIALVDLRLKDMSGDELTRQILSHSSGVRIIILTSFEGDADIERALAAGARGYVVKGTGRDDLLNAIRAVHAGRRHIPGAWLKSLPSIWVPRSSASGSCRYSGKLLRANGTRRLGLPLESLKTL
jgi:DNA-binding NarL/FixJ family response regulator